MISILFKLHEISRRPLDDNKTLNGNLTTNTIKCLLTSDVMSSLEYLVSGSTNVTPYGSHKIPAKVDLLPADDHEHAVTMYTTRADPLMSSSHCLELVPSYAN